MSSTARGWRNGSYASPLTHSRCSSTANFRATAITARFLPLLPPRSAEFQSPPSQVTALSKGSQDVVRSLHQQRS